jgi:hypothetical protein
MAELIRNDVYTIFLQYGKKNVRIACMITVIFAVWKLICFGLKKWRGFRAEQREEKRIIKKKENKIFIVFKQLVFFLLFFLFSYYLCFLAELTILTREAGTRTDVSLHFMETWNPDIYSQCFMVENVLLFLPFGAFIVLLWKRLGKIWKIFTLSFLLSLTIETIQLRTGRGYFQVDDIWLNVLGGLLGGDFGLFVREICELLVKPFHYKKRY